MNKLYLLQEDDNIFIEKLANLLIEKIQPILSLQITPSTPKEKKYLTRKCAAEHLSITPPTLDSYVADGLITKYGNGKRGRFLLDDVQNLHANLNDIYRLRRYRKS